MSTPNTIDDDKWDALKNAAGKATSATSPPKQAGNWEKQRGKAGQS